MPVNMLAELTKIVGRIPDRQTVTLANRTSGSVNADSYDTGQTFTARHGPITSGDIDGIERRWCTWFLYAIAGQTITPERYSKITDASNVVWHVVNSETSYAGYHHICECVQAVS